MAGFHRKRPCLICQKWFRPHRRLGERQKTCGSERCKREHHNRLCRDWRKRNPTYGLETRITEKLQSSTPSAASISSNSGPLDWDFISEQVGPLLAIILQALVQNLEESLRESILEKALINPTRSRSNPSVPPKESIPQKASTKTVSCPPNPTGGQKEPIGSHPKPP